MRPRRQAFGFTLIELLTVIAIMMLVMALALPNFIEIMRNRRWTSAFTNVQAMVTRARAFASTLHADFSVEFNCQDNGTAIWIESESNLIETLQGDPSTSWSYGFKWGEWAAAAGGYGENPGDGVGMLYDPSVGWKPIWPPDYGFKPEPQAAVGGGSDTNYFTYYGDNARQSEVVLIGSGITIDNTPEWSPNFISWDMLVQHSCRFGKDPYPDIRVNMTGALVQPLEPVICFRQVNSDQRRRLQVVRCTGRLIGRQ